MEVEEDYAMFYKHRPVEWKRMSPPARMQEQYPFYDHFQDLYIATGISERFVRCRVCKWAMGVHVSRLQKKLVPAIQSLHVYPTSS